MARPDGTVRFEAAGERHTLRFGINVLCEIEDRLGVTMAQLSETMKDGLAIKSLRTIVAAGVDGGIADATAGDLIDAIGVARAGELVGEAMQAAFPAHSEDAARPQKAAAGTGSNS